jgi:hypothetical protein
MRQNKKQPYLVFLKENDGDDEVAFLYSDVERLSYLIGFEMQLEDMERYTQHLVWYIVSALSPRDAIRKGYQEYEREKKDWEADGEIVTDEGFVQASGAICLSEWRYFRRLENKPYVQRSN